MKTKYPKVNILNMWKNIKTLQIPLIRNSELVAVFKDLFSYMGQH